jgi:hypothetical protein
MCNVAYINARCRDVMISLYNFCNDVRFSSVIYEGL